MKFIIILMLFTNTVFANSDQNDRKVSDLTVQELTEIVRSIVQESIEKCVVVGTMEGRAVPLSLKVEGEVIAKMTCNFNLPESESD
ncbi:MAG: hypothetical protein CMD68_05495 [Gammaproteobacteria bacterium]|nr:hypothetical protein [Gammaproteobacteria bacterium]